MERFQSNPNTSVVPRSTLVFLSVQERIPSVQSNKLLQLDLFRHLTSGGLWSAIFQNHEKSILLFSSNLRPELRFSSWPTAIWPVPALWRGEAARALHSCPKTKRSSGSMRWLAGSVLPNEARRWGAKSTAGVDD